VRHYDVSYYILSHYRAAVQVDGVLLFVRNDLSTSPDQLAALPLSERPTFTDLYARSSACPWGLIADYSDQRPSRNAQARSVKSATTRLPDGSYREVVERPADANRYRWLEIETDGGFKPDEFFVSASGAHEQGISFSTDVRSPNRYLVQVGACAQWWGFGGATFVIDHAHAQHIRSYRLIS
jgi:hypothetical protein